MLRNTLKTRSPFLTLLLTAAVITAATLAAIGYPARSDEPRAARQDRPVGKVDAGPPKGGAHVVATEHVRKTDLRRTTTQAATVHAYESVDVYSRVSGYLKSVKVDIGDVVKRGQLVAEVFVPELGAELERDEAALAQARVSVKLTQARSQVATADLDAARAEVEEAAAEVKRAESACNYHQKKLERYRDLVRRNAAGQEVLDEAEEQYEGAVASALSAKAKRSAAAAHARKAEQLVDESRAAIAEAEARVRVAEATLARTRVLLDQAHIVSPLDGTVTRRNVSEGEFVRTGDATNAPPIATIVRADKVRVVVQVPDGDVPLLKRGQRATIRIDALGSSPPLTGTVSRFAEAESPSDRTMRTEIDLDNPEGHLRPGQYGAVTIIFRERHGVLTIPVPAIAGRGRNGHADCIRVEGNHARLTKIQTGEEDGDRVEVISGLKEGDVVVTQPVLGLRDGQVIETEKRPEPGKP
jgi:RND family efflux transporter MFP subunit